MADLLQRLRNRSWRITPQRRAVAQVLTGDHVHLSAEQVYEGARTIVPEISRATVYNTLRELVGMNEILEVSSGSPPTRYDPNVDRGHHHLMCISCRELLDVYTVGEESLSLQDSHGYTLTGAVITFHGRCPDCAVRG